MPPAQIFQHSGGLLEVELSGQTDSKEHGSNNTVLGKKNSICMQLAVFESLLPPTWKLVISEN